MKRLAPPALVVLMVLLSAASVGAPSASATTLCVGGAITAPCTDGHPGGAFTLTATNFAFAVHGSNTFSCSNSTISGTAPATTATTLSIPVTLAFSGCTIFGTSPITISVPAACQDKITLQAMFTQVAAPQGAPSLTLPSGCTITTSQPSINCTMTVSGEQTLGATWVNGSSSSSSHMTLTSSPATSVVVEPGGGFGCPSAGAHTATLSGTYRVSSPAAAPGATLIP
jgi:hypothetical protein